MKLRFPAHIKGGRIISRRQGYACVPPKTKATHPRDKSFSVGVITEANGPSLKFEAILIGQPAQRSQRLGGSSLSPQSFRHLDLIDMHTVFDLAIRVRAKSENCPLFRFDIESA